MQSALSLIWRRTPVCNSPMYELCVSCFVPSSSAFTLICVLCLAGSFFLHVVMSALSFCCLCIYFCTSFVFRLVLECFSHSFFLSIVRYFLFRSFCVYFGDFVSLIMCICICTCICICRCIYICMRVCLSCRLCVCLLACLAVCLFVSFVCLLVYTYIYMRVCLRLCMCVLFCMCVFLLIFASALCSFLLPRLVNGFGASFLPTFAFLPVIRFSACRSFISCSLSAFRPPPSRPCLVLPLLSLTPCHPCK